MAEIEIGQLESQLSERIYNPTVRCVFEEYMRYGCLNCYKKMIDQMPTGVAKTIVGVQSTQVYKEKALWPIYIAERTGLDRTKAVKIGAAIDLLWGLSIIIDDILDRDQIRGGQPATWIVLGREEAEKIASLGLEVALDFLHYEVNPRVASLAIDFVRKGVGSVAVHKSMTMDVDMSVLLNNYLDRDDFHSTFPLYALYDPSIITDRELEKMSLGVRLVNQAGQLINDTRDLLPADDSGISRLSDFREGRVTVALKCLYSNLIDEDKKKFDRMFGKPGLNDLSKFQVGELTNNSNFRSQMKRRIVDTYSRGCNILSPFMSQRGTEILHKWVDYKLSILGDLL